MIRLGFAVIILTWLLSSFVYGACPSVRFVKQQQAALLVQPAVVAVPSYGASYAQTDPRIEELLRTLIEQQRQILDELRALRGQQPAVSPQTSGKAIFEVTCLKCHQPAFAAKNGDLSLVDKTGALEPLSLEMKRRIKNRVEVKGNMPPDKALPPEQAKALVDWLTADREK